jgi:LysM repeat protein
VQDAPFRPLTKERPMPRVEPVAPKASLAPAAVKPDFKNSHVGINHGDHSLNYTVKSGDTLSRISHQFGTDVDTLFQLNGHVLSDKNKIRVGDALILPTAFYVVKPGDTYSKIGRELGIDYKKLMSLNRAKTDALQVGQELTVPAVTSPAQAKVRGELKALVADIARAESKLYFGEGSFTTGVSGNTFWSSGPVESGKSYEFSHDYSTVKVWDAASDGNAPRIPVKDASAFRQLLVSDVMTGALHSRAHKYDEQHPELAGSFKVLEGPTVRDGKISFLIDEPTCHDAKVVYDSKSGKISYTHSATGEPKVVAAGKNPSEVAGALAKLFKLKLPLYQF